MKAALLTHSKLVLCVVLLAEYSRRLEEREAMIGQLTRSKAGVFQNSEDLKRQLEEESKVTLNPYKSDPSFQYFLVVPPMIWDTFHANKFKLI